VNPWLEDSSDFKYGGLQEPLIGYWLKPKVSSDALKSGLLGKQTIEQTRQTEITGNASNDPAKLKELVGWRQSLLKKPLCPANSSTGTRNVLKSHGV
jgi:hypothetical protein